MILTQDKSTGTYSMSEKLKRHLCRIGQPHIAAFAFGEYHGRATNIQLEGLTPTMADDVKAALERDPTLKMSGYFVEQDACQGNDQSWMIVFFSSHDLREIKKACVVIADAVGYRYADIVDIYTVLPKEQCGE